MNMDQEIEAILSVLEEENYPVTLADLKNPTSECMVNIALTFLSQYSIDGKTIQQATFGQMQSLSDPEAYPELISLINLHEVMVKICSRIFIKEFHFIDMINPGIKKTRRFIWTLLNFVLYGNKKIEQLIEPLMTIGSRTNTKNEFIEAKTKEMELRKEVVLENSKKTALKEKLLNQIQEAKNQLELDKKAATVLEEQEQIAKLAEQQAQEKNRSINQQVTEMNEKLIEIEATVVKSPEEYKMKLGSFKEDYSRKQEQLQELIEIVRVRNGLQSQLEEVQDFINQEYQMTFPKVKDAFLKSQTLTDTKAELSEKLKKLLDDVQNLNDNFTNSKEHSQCDTTKIEEIDAQCRIHISPILKVHNGLLSEAQDVQMRLEEAEVICQKSRIEKDDLIKRMINLNNEINEFLKDCQNLYINEIQNGAEIEKCISTKLH